MATDESKLFSPQAVLNKQTQFLLSWEPVGRGNTAYTWMLQSGEQKQPGCRLENSADEEHGWRWQPMFAGFVGYTTSRIHGCRATCRHGTDTVCSRLRALGAEGSESSHAALETMGNFKMTGWSPQTG